MTDKMQFKRLFEPVKVGSMTVKNRIVLPGMATGFFSREGLVTEQAKGYYEARAQGGAGLITVEATCVDFPRGYGLTRPAIDSDIAIPGLSELARVIKKHGARAAIQLYHAGRIARPKVTGFLNVAPSPISYPIAGLIQTALPKELSVAEIVGIVYLFARAAGRAKQAGFEGIEIHAAHAYLLAQFLSPSSNQRQDAYGGNAANRARILVEVLTAIRKEVGKDFPLWCRITAEEYGVEGGLTLEDARTTAKMVNSLVDAIHISAWGYGRSPASYIYVPDVPGKNLPLAAEIKRVVTVPVIAVGRLTPEVAEQALADGKADMVAIGRGLLADPEMPNKLQSNKYDECRPCIACFYCSDVTDMGSPTTTCAVNPAVGREADYAIRPAVKTRRIAVVGGGPAGMEAARVLARRGHQVTLFEKADRLGGQLGLAVVPPAKKELLSPFLNYQVDQLKKLKVKVKLNTTVTFDLIKTLKPDFVIIATGAVPLVPPVPYAEGAKTITAFDILSGKVEAGQKVVVVGGGSTGCETADYLQSQGKEVTLIEMAGDLAGDMGPREKLRLLSKLNSLPITIKTGTRCAGIQQGGINVVTKDGGEQFVKADTVVLAAGTAPEHTLFEQLRDNGFETRLIGDAWHIGRIAGAINEGWSIGCAL